MADDVIETDRLRLVLLGRAVFTALAAGDIDTARTTSGLALPAGWAEDGLWPWQLQKLEADPTVEPWLARAIVERAGDTVVGNVGFHLGPVDGMVEIGYAVQAEHRRRGYGGEAAAGMLRWASTQPGVTTLRASVSPDNLASLALIRRLGFGQVGEQWDDKDGRELVFERAAEIASRPAAS